MGQGRGVIMMIIILAFAKNTTLRCYKALAADLQLSIKKKNWDRRISSVPKFFIESKSCKSAANIKCILAICIMSMYMDYKQQHALYCVMY
jgi:hypothetical protein